MRPTLGLSLCLLLLALPSAAERDFLTTDEVEQVRLMQEPNARLILYAGFAQQRIDLLKHFLSEEKAGRSSLIHETLEDYTKIIETIDVVTDDALLRKVDLAEGMTKVVEAEEGFAKALEEIQEAPPKDIGRYRFVLDIAMETTTDSLDINREDLGERAVEAKIQEKKERKGLQEMMTPEMARERNEQADEMKKTEEKEKRKAPTLFKKGEKKQKEQKDQ